MDARELFIWLGAHTTDEDEIQLEVGGDGAIHTGNIKHVRRESSGVVTLSTEEAY
jgi:hypothetical protein